MRLKMTTRQSAIRTPAEHGYASYGSSLSLGVRDFGLFPGPGGTGGDCLPSLAVTRNEGVRGSNPRVGLNPGLGLGARASPLRAPTANALVRLSAA